MTGLALALTAAAPAQAPSRTPAAFATSCRRARTGSRTPSSARSWPPARGRPTTTTSSRPIATCSTRPGRRARWTSSRTRASASSPRTSSAPSTRARRHDRARPPGRAAHLRRARARARCSAPATRPPRTGCSSSTSSATSAARSCPRSPAARRPTAPSTTWSGPSRRTPRPTCSARSTPSAPGLRARGGDAARGPRRLRGRDQPATSPRRGWTRPSCPASTRRSAGRRAPRTGRAPTRWRRRWSSARSSASAAAASWPRRACSSARRRASARARGLARLARLPLRRRPGGADDRPRQALPLPAPPRQGPRPRAARPPERHHRDVQVAGTGSGSRPRAGRARRAAVEGRLPRRDVQRDPGLRARVGERPAARRLRPADRLLRPAGADGAGGPGAGHLGPRRRLPGRQPVRADRPRARLRVERDDLGAGHRRHLRRRPCTLRRPTTSPLPLPRRLRADRALERRNAWQPNAADPTPAGQRDAGHRAHEARPGRRPRRRSSGRPVAYTRLRATYMHEPDSGLAFAYFNDPDRIKGPTRLPARRVADRLHVQLVLRRRAPHRLPERRLQPAPRAGHRPRPADPRPRRLRVARLRPRARSR